jgi:hypothetical protein
MNGYGVSPLELMACEAFLQGLVYLDEFTYSITGQTLDNTQLIANGVVDYQMQINADSDFIAQEYNLFAWADSAGTPIANPDYLIQIIRSGSGRELMNRPQHTANYCGNYRSTSASYPGRKAMPSLYQGNLTVTIRLTNRTATVPNRVDFAMLGFKVFYQTNRQGQTGNRQDIFHAL